MKGTTPISRRIELTWESTFRVMSLCFCSVAVIILDMCNLSTYLAMLMTDLGCITQASFTRKVNQLGLFTQR